MNPPECLLMSRFSAELLVVRLRFLSTPHVMSETFQSASVPMFSADVWAQAADELVQRLEAGRAVTMDRTNTLILVEALEGFDLGPATQSGRQQIAALLAKRLEPFIGRQVTLDFGHHGA
ncbi:hypothetical protein [Pseudomonas viridiflava]|uniref:hypothetical protein n=2 Tax=Pseudomonas viridiflava TaxID=33069 RepID=UPI000F03F724|nr:hypothetical protein [Pseudomonas viridiflava]